MRQIDGWFLLSQPKYRVPCVFDLHVRGLFREKPAVTSGCGARILINNNLHIAVEYRFLKHGQTVCNQVFYTYATKQGILTLDEQLSLNLIAVNEEVTDSGAIQEIKQVYEQWCQDYIPTDSRGGHDIPALQRKLQTSLDETKKKLREELKRKNGIWIASRVPALARYFFRWQEGQIAEDLFDSYNNQKGEDTEIGLINKVAQFYTICDTTEPTGLDRTDGASWSNEDEMWECWVGFAGSEEEAGRVIRTMDEVFRTQAF